MADDGRVSVSIHVSLCLFVALNLSVCLNGTVLAGLHKCWCVCVSMHDRVMVCCSLSLQLAVYPCIHMCVSVWVRVSLVFSLVKFLLFVLVCICVDGRGMFVYVSVHGRVMV